MSPGQAARARSAFDVAVMLVFFAALVAPFADSMLRPKAQAAQLAAEERVAARLPAFDRSVKGLGEFPARFEAWQNDNFGLRDKLLRWHSLLKMCLLGVSPTQKVVLGQDDWVFLTEEHSIEIARGIDPLTPRELDAWRRSLESRRDYCSSIGAHYQFVIAPNKSEVYPEYMPARFNRVGPTRLDQLLAYMREHSTLPILDLRAAMMAEKAHDRDGDFAYYPLGTHWTDRGVYAGYVAILEALRASFPSLVPIARDGVAWTQAGHEGDTWAARLYMNGRLHQQNLIGTLIQEFPTAVLADHGNNSLSTVHRNKNLPSLIAFHDSFGEPLRKFLIPHFSKATFIWQDGFDVARISAEKPNVVLQLYVERKLRGSPPAMASSGAGSPSHAAFEASKHVLMRLDLAQPNPPIEAQGNPGITATRHGLEIAVSSASDAFLLPAFEFPADERTILHVDIEAPSAATLDILYKTTSESTYKRTNAYRIDLVPGRNEIYLEMLATDMFGRLLVRPGVEPDGTFVLHALEARGAR